MNAFSLQGTDNYIDYCSVYETRDGEAQPLTLDYFVTIHGSNNGIDNCYTERRGVIGHPGHGVQLDGNVLTTQYNTVRHCTAKGLKGEALSCRHDTTSYNTFEDCIALAGDGTSGQVDNAGIGLRDGTHHNRFKRCQSIGGNAGVTYWDSVEKGEDTPFAQYNSMEYCIFRDNVYGVQASHDSAYTSTVTNESFINCIFDGQDYLTGNIYGTAGTDADITLIITNSIITGITVGLQHRAGTHTLTLSNCDFYNNIFAAPSGTAIITSDPKFVDQLSHDYSLLGDSLCINAGKDMSLTDGDFREMALVGLPDMGVLEYQN